MGVKHTQDEPSENLVNRGSFLQSKFDLVIAPTPIAEKPERALFYDFN